MLISNGLDGPLALPSEVPHRYQEEVFERAQRENIIAALNTGSGKTLISLLLIKWISAQTSSQEKLVIFLVPKVTLVVQQYDYLKKRTSLRVGKLHGATDAGRALNDRKGWKDMFESNNIIVMTAQIFLNLLTHSLWSIDKVSLMVFDECHHARKNHPYNGIMREYFQVSDISKRPKIFGMTASPIWNMKNPSDSIATLEANMDAKVISVIQNVDELLKNTPKAHEEIIQYPNPPEYFDYPSPTIYDYFRVVEQRAWDQLDLPWPKVEIRYISTLTNVGPYCASLFLYLEIRGHIETYIAENKSQLMELDLDEMMDILPSSSVSPKKQTSEDLLLIVEILHEFSPFFPSNEVKLVSPTPIPLKWCTPKVKVLVDILVDYYHHAPSFQGIIFVEQRQIASTLAKMLPAIPELAGKISCAFIVGQGVNKDGISNHKERSHGDPVALFRQRAINILIATSVAEEGLDFPECELVVRFDSLHHMVGYIQSRGRARNKRAAKFIVMIRENDEVQLEKFRSLQIEEPKLNNEYQTRHAIQDEDGQDDDDDEYVDEAMYQADLRERERYVEPATGAVITYDNALNLLSYLCSLIPRDSYTQTHKPRYTEGFQTTLSLPRALPLAPADLTFVGPFKHSYKEAKRATAFMAVKRLRELDVFDEFLLPIPTTSDDFQGTLNQFRGQKKNYKKIPPILTVAVRDPWCISDKLWIHPIVINGQAVTGLVTGTALPPEEILIRGDQVTTLQPKLLDFDAESEYEFRRQMHEFTKLGVWYSNTTKTISSALSFYLVPITEEHEPDYEAIRLLLHHPNGIADWNGITELDYDNVLVLNTRRSGGIYLLRNVRHDLSPLSSPLPGSRESQYLTYRDYWLVKWARKKYQIVIPTDGPVLETLVVTRSTMGTHSLDPSPEDSLPAHSVPNGHLLPQGSCRWLPVKYKIWQAFGTLPVLCHRMTNNYRVRCARFELGLPYIHDKLMIEAFTIPSTTLPFNNQRLETLGDAVLQLCTTVHLLNEYPNRHEGQLTKLRQKIVSNNYLMHRALDLSLDQFVNSEIPSVHQWRYVLSENDTSSDDRLTPIRYATREYPRRSLQDCMEALLGASFLTGGLSRSLEMGTALGLEIGGPLPWYIRYPLKVVEPSGIGALFNDLEDSLGYKFRHNHLLLESLTHPSVMYSDAPSYQRLEFLGDAILDLAVVKYLYDKFPMATSHQLAHARTKAICAPTLANIAVRKLGLHKRILVNSMDLNLAIDQYVPLLEGVSGEEIVRSSWKHDPPKVLSDVFESLLGAVLVDSGYDYEKTAAVVEYVMADVLEALSPDVAKDPISEMVEWMAANGCTQYSLLPQMKKTEHSERNGITVLVHNQVIVGPIVSTSLNVAKFLAAERAFAVLKNPDSTKSLKSLCDCAMAMVTDLTIEDSPVGIHLADLDGDDDITDVANIIISDEINKPADVYP